MKKHIKIKDFNGKEEVIVKNEKATDHLQSQIKHKHIIFRDRTKYSRKQKHRNKNCED
jgi:hypothetical protein